MSDRPSDGWDIDDLRDEFDWIIEFQSRMAERIRGDADVHNLVDYVGKLEAENAKLRELVRDMHKWLWNGADCTECPFAAKCDLNAAFESDIHAHICLGWSEIHDRMSELGVEV